MVAAQRQLRDAEDWVLGVSSEVLREDDKVLSNLDSAAAKLTPVGSEDLAIPRERAMCAKLVGNHTEDILCRLDRLYLELLMSPTGTTESAVETDTELQISLKVELDSLYTEIKDLNQIFVIQEFQTPLTEASNRKATRYQDAALKFLLYVRDPVVFGRRC